MGTGWTNLLNAPRDVPGNRPHFRGAVSWFRIHWAPSASPKDPITVISLASTRTVQWSHGQDQIWYISQRSHRITSGRACAQAKVERARPGVKSHALQPHAPPAPGRHANILNLRCLINLIYAPAPLCGAHGRGQQYRAASVAAGRGRRRRCETSEDEPVGGRTGNLIESTFITVICWSIQWFWNPKFQV